MKIWILWIKNTRLGLKWIDSIWASEGHANERREAVAESLKRAGVVGYDLFLWDAKIADAAVVEAQDAPGVQREVGAV